MPKKPRGTIYYNPDLPEQAQCRQMCYQLAIHLAKRDNLIPKDQMTPDVLDAIGQNVVRLMFDDGKPAAPSDPHPLIGRPLHKAPWMN